MLTGLLCDEEGKDGSHHEEVDGRHVVYFTEVREQHAHTFLHFTASSPLHLNIGFQRCASIRLEADENAGTNLHRFYRECNWLSFGYLTKHCYVFWGF